MKMPSRWNFDRATDPGERDRAYSLHEEQQRAIQGGYKSVRVTTETHKLLRDLKATHGNRGEWSLDAILRQLLKAELEPVCTKPAAAKNVHTARSRNVHKRSSSRVCAQIPTSDE